MPIQLNGATSGSTTLSATDAVTVNATLPAGGGTLLSSTNPQSGGVRSEEHTSELQSH